MKIFNIIFTILASVIIAFTAGAIYAQLGLKFNPRIFTTYIGTVLVITVMLCFGILAFKIFFKRRRKNDK